MTTVIMSDGEVAQACIYNCSIIVKLHSGSHSSFRSLTWFFHSPKEKGIQSQVADISGGKLQLHQYDF